MNVASVGVGSRSARKAGLSAQFPISGLHIKLTFSGKGIGFPAGGTFLGSGESLCDLLILFLIKGEEGSSVALRFEPAKTWSVPHL